MRLTDAIKILFARNVICENVELNSRVGYAIANLVSQLWILQSSNKNIGLPAQRRATQMIERVNSVCDSMNKAIRKPGTNYRLSDFLAAADSVCEM
jgi:hypothetical protein